MSTITGRVVSQADDVCDGGCFKLAKCENPKVGRDDGGSLSSANQ